MAKNKELSKDVRDKIVDLLKAEISKKIPKKNTHSKRFDEKVTIIDLALWIEDDDDDGDDNVEGAA